MSSGRASRKRTVALVESATQLLNTLEWAHATQEFDDVLVAVLVPKDQNSRTQLATVAEFATGAGLEVRMVDVRSGTAGVAGEGFGLARRVAGARRLVIGDPFSRMIQALLPLSRAEQIVVVDDGTATWEFAQCIDEGKPLVRWRLANDGSAHLAARATRRLSPSTARKITVFSCLSGATPVGATGIVNGYAWTRSWQTPQVRAGEIDVIGASLVETGVVDRQAYLEALRRLTARFTPVRYLAHRRESENRLAEIATLPGVTVARSDLPVELFLRRGPVAQHVITFPSTVAYTLPVVLSDLGEQVRLEVKRVESTWFTPSTTAHARDFVARIGEDAPLRPVLEIA